MRVLVLGAGFGGLELTTRLSHELGASADITLVDRADAFVFGFSKLDVLFGRVALEHVAHPYRDLVHPGVRFVQTTVRSIDPGTMQVETDVGVLDSDVLVVALGADLHPEATPGFVEDGQDLYSVGAMAASRDAIARFDGGRVVVGVTSTPFKCPPAPSETALLMDDLLVARGVRERSEIALVMPFGRPIPPSPDASSALLAAFAERGIAWLPDRLVARLDPSRRVAVTGDGEEVPYDLFLGVPKHRAPDVVLESGLTEDGWVPVDPRTLSTRFPDVYAVGDVTSVGTPKAGVFAEGQAAAVADQIVARVRGDVEPQAYDGRGVCYLELGHELVAKVDVTFLGGAAPVGTMDGPSKAIAADKSAFGASRIARWFSREWTPLG